MAPGQENTSRPGKGVSVGRWRRRAGQLTAAGSWLSLAGALGAWALLQAGDIWWPATFLMFGPRWVLLLAPAALVPVAAFLRRRSLGVLLAALLVILGPVMGFCIPWARLGPGAEEGTRLRVLTCNLHYGRPARGPLDRLLQETRPDVVALQEGPEKDVSPALAGGEWHVRAAPGLFLASRFPIRRADLMGKGSTGEKGSVMRYELETPAGVVVLYNVHLATPRRGLLGVVREGLAANQKLQEGSDLRGQQLENLAWEAGLEPAPVLVLGDFNTPPESALLRGPWAGYTNAFSSAGWGWGYTFFSRNTMVRIDHVLASPEWRCERSWVGPNVGSPHRPVLADLVLPGPD